MTLPLQPRHAVEEPQQGDGGEPAQARKAAVYLPRVDLFRRYVERALAGVVNRCEYRLHEGRSLPLPALLAVRMRYTLRALASAPVAQKKAKPSA